VSDPNKPKLPSRKDSERALKQVRENIVDNGASEREDVAVDSDADTVRDHPAPVLDADATAPDGVEAVEVPVEPRLPPT
jgi:hypothetical protein